MQTSSLGRRRRAATWLLATAALAAVAALALPGAARAAFPGANGPISVTIAGEPRDLDPVTGELSAPPMEGTGPGPASWSADGETFAYMVPGPFVDGERPIDKLYVSSADGTDRRLVAESPGWTSVPRFTADGDLVATKTVWLENYTYRTEAWHLPVDSEGSPAKLADDLRYIEGAPTMMLPSPTDGDTVFVTQADPQAFGTPARSLLRLERASLGEGTLTLIEGPFEDGVRFVDTMPDGERLLGLVDKIYGDRSNEYAEWFVYDIATGERTPIATFPRDVNPVAVSPDGQQIVYTTYVYPSPEPFQVRTIGIDGDDDRLVLASAQSVYVSAWRPGTERPITVNEASDEPDADGSDGACDVDPAAEGDQCTLRAAIQEANERTTAADDLEEIAFDLPGGGVPAITLTSPLPAVEASVSIDGTTQPGAGQVRLIGAAGDGLVLDGPGSEVAGLVITGFTGHGLVLRGGGATVWGNVIGGAPDGECADPCTLGNGGDGIRIASSDNHVGDRRARHEITAPLERPHAGGEANVIGWNAGSGIAIESGRRNDVVANDFPGNAGLAIDLGADGVSANDPGDADAGPNGGLNAPVLTLDDRDNAAVAGAVRAAPNSSYFVELFASDVPCETEFGSGGGRYASGEPFGGPDPSTLVHVETDDRGIARFEETWVAVGEPASLTAVLVHGDEVSEFSNCVSDGDGDGISDLWERDGLDADRDGEIDMDLPRLGATVGRKDVFVEVDATAGQRLGNAALTRVRDAFADAPVDNVDGSTGISLHIDNGQAAPREGGGSWGTASRSETLPRTPETAEIVIGQAGKPLFEPLEKLEREHLEFDRSLVSYYVYATGTLKAGSQTVTGLAWGTVSTNLDHPPGPGRALLLGLQSTCPGTAPCAGSDDAQAGVFMHELGHLFGLGHGGGDSLNLKPNHFSVMNYAFTVGQLGTVKKELILDYSRIGPSAAEPGTHGWIPALDENALDEPAGLRGQTVAEEHRRRSLYVCPAASGAPTVGVIPDITAPVDWNCDGDTTDTEIAENINFDHIIAPTTGFPLDKYSVLETLSEWTVLDLTGHARPDPPHTPQAPGPEPEELQLYTRALWDDDEAPQLTVEVGPERDGEREVTVRAADDEQLDSVIVGVDGHAETVPAPFVADGIKDDEMVHTVRVSGPGDHLVEAFAVDRAQNASTVVQRTVTISTPTPPPGPPATGSGPAPAGAPPAPPAPPSGGPSGAGSSSDATPRHPAKLEVPRVRVHRGRLDVLARITERATGELRATFRAAGQTTRFTVPIRGRTVRIDRPLSRAQARAGTGILTLTYAGDDQVRPDDVRLRAADGKARLVRTRSRIRKGMLEVAGTISRSARGVVRLRLDYVGADGAVGSLRMNAAIRDGRWSLSEKLPSDAARSGGQLSIQYTGYGPRNIRGEQLSKEVRP